MGHLDGNGDQRISWNELAQPLSDDQPASWILFAYIWNLKHLSEETRLDKIVNGTLTYGKMKWPF